MAEGENQNVIQKLEKVLGFPTSNNAIGKGVFQEALKKVQDKRDKAQEGKAMELIEKAIDCSEKWNEVKRQFLKQEKKFEKDLGKLVKGIESMASGKKQSQDENQEKTD